MMAGAGTSEIRAATQLISNSDRVFAAAVGYFVSCAVAPFIVLLVVGSNGRNWNFDFELLFGLKFFVVFYLITFFFCLPGFIILRLTLHKLRRRDGFSFALAGALLGLVTFLVFGVAFLDAKIETYEILEWEFLQWLFLGGSAGAVEYFSELLFFNRLVKRRAVIAQPIEKEE